VAFLVDARTNNPLIDQTSNKSIDRSIDPSTQSTFPIDLRSSGIDEPAEDRDQNKKKAKGMLG
jgi:hypothetical protein